MRTYDDESELPLPDSIPGRPILNMVDVQISPKFFRVDDTVGFYLARRSAAKKEFPSSIARAIAFGNVSYASPNLNQACVAKHFDSDAEVRFQSVQEAVDWLCEVEGIYRRMRRDEARLHNLANKNESEI